MAENGPRWPMMTENCSEVESCLGAALVKLVGGDMDFKTVDGFVMALETGFTFVLVNVNGWGGGGRRGAGALREPMDSNRSFPVFLFSIPVVGQFELPHLLQIFVSCSAVNCNV